MLFFLFCLLASLVFFDSSDISDCYCFCGSQRSLRVSRYVFEKGAWTFLPLQFLHYFPKGVACGPPSSPPPGLHVVLSAAPPELAPYSFLPSSYRALATCCVFFFCLLLCFLRSFRSGYRDHGHEHVVHYSLLALLCFDSFLICPNVNHFCL